MNRRTRTSTRWITASALALALPLLAACSGDTDTEPHALGVDPTHPERNSDTNRDRARPANPADLRRTHRAKNKQPKTPKQQSLRTPKRR